MISTGDLGPCTAHQSTSANESVIIINIRTHIIHLMSQEAGDGSAGILYCARHCVSTAFDTKFMRPWMWCMHLRWAHIGRSSGVGMRQLSSVLVECDSFNAAANRMCSLNIWCACVAFCLYENATATTLCFFYFVFLLLFLTDFRNASAVET